MFSDNITIGQAAFISIFSMIIVFVVLLIISYLVDFVAYFILRNFKK
ncbi:MAG: OadG family protein [Lachnospiraceae bacterium]|nr:OadG family protein [Lachnospiraceae bacterium]